MKEALLAAAMLVIEPDNGRTTEQRTLQKWQASLMVSSKLSKVSSNADMVGWAENVQKKGW